MGVFVYVYFKDEREYHEWMLNEVRGRKNIKVNGRAYVCKSPESLSRYLADIAKRAEKWFEEEKGPASSV